MKSIDAIIIAKNEHQNIKECIESLGFCKKIIVVDNGSTDNTAQIAKQSGAHVITHPGSSFAALRNTGIKSAVSELVLYVDADERVSESLKKSIEGLLTKETTHAAYRVQRKNYYYGKNPWPFIEKLERLFRKDALEEWFGELHETPKVKGEIGDLDGFLLHYSHQDLTSMVDKTNEWSDIEAQLRFRSGHPKMTSWRFFRVMATAFYDSYIKQGGYRAGSIGIIESIYQSFSMFITYAKLWELQNKKK
jgi:glycosyltransferase involved in cell wall biosynthesis